MKLMCQIVLNRTVIWLICNILCIVFDIILYVRGNIDNEICFVVQDNGE